jgi:alpha-tubulin suppressor-like RCC1 family protein
VPVAVQGLGSGVQAIAAGGNHTCALSNGGIQCWGDNTTGDVGNNSTNEALVPVAVVTLTGGVQTIAAGGDHSCALSNGTVECWGGNARDDLGDNSTAESNVPVPVSPWAP